MHRASTQDRCREGPAPPPNATVPKTVVQASTARRDEGPPSSRGGGRVGEGRVGEGGGFRGGAEEVGGGSAAVSLEGESFRTEAAESMRT